jgi:E3 ubiquitin-protein ligase ZNF598
MSANNSNSTDNQTGSEQSYRGNRQRRQQGGRHYHHSRYSNPRTSASQSSRVAVANRSPSNLNGDQNSISPNDSICFICAEPVHYFAVSECNHKLCHLCSLRLRALYKNKNCAYCKVMIKF